MKENNIFTRSFGRGSLRKEKGEENSIRPARNGKQNRIVAKWWTSFWAIFLLNPDTQKSLAFNETTRE